MSEYHKEDETWSPKHYFSIASACLLDLRVPRDVSSAPSDVWRFPADDAFSALINPLTYMTHRQ